MEGFCGSYVGSRGSGDRLEGRGRWGELNDILACVFIWNVRGIIGELEKYGTENVT